MARLRPGERSAVRIDVESQHAWCGTRRLHLRPRVFAVLRHLVERPERLITKEELLGAVWRDSMVSDAALASCIRDLRKALGDSSGAPRYIETVHRRGFRFIGPVARPEDAPSETESAALAPPTAVGSAPTAARTRPDTGRLVGRSAELGRLHACLERALSGQRQLVFVTGEPGIGKTALVEAFVAEIAGGEAMRVGRGQCVDHYGTGEAYLPLLEALARLGRGAGGERLVAILMQHAPTWLAQLPGLLDDERLDALRRRTQGATRERMLRELVEGLDILARDAPLVLLLEDLHWSDSATVDLLGMLARRREAARLLIVATYRPADIAAEAHPLRPVKQELQSHGQCEEIALPFLGPSAVDEYLAHRFPGHGFPRELPPLFHRATDGNPLFLVNTVDYLIGQGALRQLDGQWRLAGSVEAIAPVVPETLWQMVERQVERLTPEEHEILAVASVAGAEFSAAVVAAGGIDAQDGERRCDKLARHGQFVRATGVAEWPDGTVATRYAFIHALYQQVLYAGVSVRDRVNLHLGTGERLERGHGGRSGEIAGELAMHFEQGRDFARAAQYRRQAGDNALRRHAYREAADHARRGLHLLRGVPWSTDRMRQELTLHVMLGSALATGKGHAAREVEEVYARALELCEQLGDTPETFPVLTALGWSYVIGGSPAGRDVAQRLSAMAEATRDPAVDLAAHNAAGLVSFYRGELDTALAHLERGSQHYDPARDSPNVSPAFRFVLDPGMSCAVHGAWALWLMGYPSRAATRMREALALARAIKHPFTFAHACRFAAAFHLSRRECDAAEQQEDANLAISTEHGFGPLLLAGRFHRGWLLAEQGRAEQGLAQMEQWVAACRDIRAEILLPSYLAWLAEVYGKIGRPADGLALVQEAMAATTRSGYQYWTAELYRLKGVLTREAEARAGAGTDDAESSLLEAIAIARRQRAKSLELRAATSLGRMWADQGKRGEARALLSEVHRWFTEGFDTPDLRDAAALLEALGTGAGSLAANRTTGRCEGST